MKKALISPLEVVYNLDNIAIGVRIAEVRDDLFPVADPLYWIDCDDIIDANQYYYNEQTEIFDLIPRNVFSLEEMISMMANNSNEVI